MLKEVELVALYSLLNHLPASFCLDQNIQVLVLEVVDGVGIGLVDGDDVLDIAGDVVYPAPQHYQLHLEPALLVGPKVQDVLRNALPVEIVVGAFGKVDADVDVFGVEDVLYPELDLELKEDVFLEVEGDLVLDHYLDVEGKLNAQVGVFGGSDGDRLGINHSDISLAIAP